MTPFVIIFGILGFILSCFLAFYIPGRVLLGKTDFSFLPTTLVSIVVGIVLWALQGIVFGYLHIREVSYVYLLVFLALFIWKRYHRLSKISLSIDIPAAVIVVIGVFGQIIPYLRMGWQSPQGIIIAAHNPDDHIWHAALVKELVKRFPPNEPAISGVVLKDYHYFYNLIAAELIRVFHLPFFVTQFDGLYLLAPLLLGGIVYVLSQSIWQNKLFTRLFLFFVYFSGDAAGWVMLAMHRTFTWNLSSLINDASKFVDSPPYGYAIVIALSGLFLLLQYKEKLPKHIIVICALLFGTLMEFKIYVGIPFLFAFGAYAFSYLLRKRITPLVSFVFAGVFAYVLLKLGSSSSAGLIFLPVDIPRDFINQPLLGLTDWQLRWIIYQNHHSLFRLIQYGAMMAGLYLLVQFGLQLFGLLPFPQTLKKLGTSLSLFLYTGVVSAFILGLFFYQTVGGANIWEFFLAAAPLLSLLAALSLSLFLAKQTYILRLVLLGIIAVILIPQWLISVQSYIYDEYFTGFHGVTKAQEASFNFLSSQTPKHAVIFLANQKAYSYASIANLFVERDLYLSGNGVRQIVTSEIAKRRQEVQVITASTNSKEIAAVLKRENIHFIYYYGAAANLAALKNAHLRVVFTNSAATIFQVQ